MTAIYEPSQVRQNGPSATRQRDHEHLKVFNAIEKQMKTKTCQIQYRWEWIRENTMPYFPNSHSQKEKVDAGQWSWDGGKVKCGLYEGTLEV